MMISSATSTGRLAPGPWFNSVGIEECCHLYGEIRKKLDPKRVYAELVALVVPEEPVLLCWEVPPFTAPRPIPHSLRLTVVTGPHGNPDRD
jgi:hypothetical protein